MAPSCVHSETKDRHRHQCNTIQQSSDHVDCSAATSHTARPCLKHSAHTVHSATAFQTLQPHPKQQCPRCPQRKYLPKRHNLRDKSAHGAYSNYTPTTFEGSAHMFNGTSTFSTSRPHPKTVQSLDTSLFASFGESCGLTGDRSPRRCINHIWMGALLSVDEVLRGFDSGAGLPCATRRSVWGWSLCGPLGCRARVCVDVTARRAVP